MGQQIVGIDIGTYSVKIACLERSFKSFEFVRFYERKIPYNELLSPEESISSALQGLIEDSGIRWDTCICGYPGQKTGARLLTFPFGNLKKIDQSIEFELENYIPFELKDSVLDYHVVSSTKEASQVLVVYSLKTPFAKWIEMLKNNHLDPKIVAAEGVELLNLMVLGMVPPDSPYAIVDIGHSKTNVTLCRGKKLLFTRSVLAAGRQITESIRKALGVSVEEAEKIKVEMAQLQTGEKKEFMDDLSRQVSSATEQAVEELLLNLRQILFAYQDKEGEPIGGIYLTGGSSRLQGLDRYLSIRLKQNVTHIDCTDFHFSRLEETQSHRTVMPQALALALRGVSAAGQPDINFRRGEFAFKGDVEKLGGDLRHVAIALGLVVVAALAQFSIRYVMMKQKVNTLKQEIGAMVKQVLPNAPAANLSSPGSALNLLKGKENEIKDRLSRLNAELEISALGVLKEVSAKMPARAEIALDVEDLNILADRVRLSGRADSFVTVDKIKSALEASSYFRNVTTGNVRKGVKDEVKFDLSMEIAKE